MPRIDEFDSYEENTIDCPKCGESFLDDNFVCPECGFDSEPIIDEDENDLSADELESDDEYIREISDTYINKEENDDYE